MRTAARWTAAAFLVATAVVTAPAGAYELSGGVGAGGVLAGTVPRFAVAPHAGVSWRLDGGFHLAIGDLCDVLPAARGLGVGVYNQAYGAIGYAGEKADFSIGPSLSAYSLPACGATLRASEQRLPGAVQAAMRQDP
jgi:hypothetical protein